MTRSHHPRYPAAFPALRTGGTAVALAVLAALVAPLPAAAVSARDGGQAHAMMPATVSVTGHGEAATSPDQATIRLGVGVQADSAAEAMTNNAALQRKVMAVVLDAGVEARDVQTSDLGLDAVQNYSGDGQAPEITGYRARNIVTVRVRDLDRLGEVLDSVIAAGANEIQGITFSRDDTGEVETKARKRAVESARAHAEEIADAAGMKLGRLLSISEGGGAGPIRPLMMRAMADSAVASIPVAEGELSVTVDVSAIWQLRPADDADRRTAPADTASQPEAGSNGAAPADATPDGGSASNDDNAATGTDAGSAEGQAGN